MADTVTHIVGTPVVIGPLVRQRCAWCGEVLEDWDLRQTFAPNGVGLSPWQVGCLVRVHELGRTNLGPLPDGELDSGQLPPDWCGAERLPDNVVRAAFGAAK